MKNFMTSRFGRVFIFALLGILLGGLIALGSLLWERNTQTVLIKKDPHQNSATMPIQNLANIGGDFSLTDMNGHSVTAQDFRDKFKFLYFGFTYCPTICPTELQKMASVMNALTPEQQDKVHFLFVTIDPERDTAPVMKDYVGLFHPKLIGLTGTQEQINAVKKEFKIYAAKIPQGDSYTMDHSSFIYVFDKQDRLKAIFRSSDTEEKILKRMQELLS
jgi:protein SCO1